MGKISKHSSRNNRNYIRKWHCICIGYYENNGILLIQEKVVGKFGEYGGKPTFNGIGGKYKTYFPKEWMLKQVIENIVEAYDNFLAKKLEPKLHVDGKYHIISETKAGFKIEMIIDKKCNMTTAYPLI